VLAGYSGDTVICAGEQGTLRVDSIPGAGYSWALPENWLGSSLTHELIFIPSDDPGEVAVTGYNACGTGDSLTIPVRVNTIPGEARILTFSQNICENSVDSFYVHGEEGVQHAWGVPYGWEIISGGFSDTVVVQVGENPGQVELTSTNRCGSSSSERYISLEPAPDEPLISSVASKYEHYQQFELQNASTYKSFRWLRNGLPVSSEEGNSDVYVAYIPGIYAVEVTSREGCVLVYPDDRSLNISAPDRLCAAYCGGNGKLVVESHPDMTTDATLKVHDLAGNILINRIINPGYNEIQTTLKGVYIVSVTGWGNEQLFRLFMH